MLNGDITHLLDLAGTGDSCAQDELVTLVYEEIHRLAKVRMADQPAGHTLQPTALINEAFVKILQCRPLKLGQNRFQFFPLAARAIRSVLVDHARRGKAAKRQPNGNRKQIVLDTVAEFEKIEQLELLCLDESLLRLQQINDRQYEIVMLHFFGGLQFKEIAQHLNVSTSTVEKDWYFARAWLCKDMSGDAADE